MIAPTAFEIIRPFVDRWPSAQPAAATEPKLPHVGKRLLDVTSAFVLLVFLAPILVLVAVVIKLSSPGRVLFVQKRVGYGCRVFPMFKFRTMVEGAELSQSALAANQVGRTFVKVFDDPRVTGIGRWLRKYSLDELPQLLNVLRGDMSLVGPRPILLADFHNFPLAEQMRRFSKLPGMTGLWQVSGRSQTSDERRMELDLRYVDEWGLGLDVVILSRTLPVVLRATGAV